MVAPLNVFVCEIDCQMLFQHLLMMTRQICVNKHGLDNVGGELSVIFPQVKKKQKKKKTVTQRQLTRLRTTKQPNTIESYKREAGGSNYMYGNNLPRFSLPWISLIRVTWQVVPSFFFLLISTAFVVLSRVGCLWVTSV